MALRLLELFIPAERRPEVQELVEEHRVEGVWHEELSGDEALVRLLLPTEMTEPLLDKLEKRFSGLDGFRVVILSVEASVPRLEAKEAEEAPPGEAPEAAEAEQKTERISREELYNDVTSVTRFSRVYLVMVVLSTIVAAVGLTRSSVAVVIGAMVIAPLLGPNVALSLATTLGDGELAKKAMNANLLGLLAALVVAVLIGLVVNVDPSVPEIASRTRVGLGDIALGLAAGSAGTLAFTSGLSAALTGVMVAVALLPPLVTLGLLVGSGHGALALGALLLLLANIICVNLAGVATFLLQGIRPLSWWEADRAKRATRMAMSLWACLLAALLAVIVLSRGG